MSKRPYGVAIAGLRVDESGRRWVILIVAVIIVFVITISVDHVVIVAGRLNRVARYKGPERALVEADIMVLIPPLGRRHVLKLIPSSLQAWLQNGPRP